MPAVQTYNNSRTVLTGLVMQREKLTIRLPKQNLDFVKHYAAEHHLTVTEVIDRYLSRLRQQQYPMIHPDVESISGLVPSDIDAKQDYHEHILQKHR
jgi:hypothetical protein